MYEFKQSPFTNDPEDLELIVDGTTVALCWRDVDKWTRTDTSRYLIYWAICDRNLRGFAYTLKDAKAIMCALNGVEYDRP